jgi:hypothetical protein
MEQADVELVMAILRRGAFDLTELIAAYERLTERETGMPPPPEFDTKLM